MQAGTAVSDSDRAVGRPRGRRMPLVRDSKSEFCTEGMAGVGLMRGLPLCGDSRERGHDAVVDEVTPNQPTMPIP